MKRVRVAANLLLGVTLAFVCGCDTALALELPAHKDALFAYDPLTATRDDGSYLDVPYSEARDIDRRDEIPERKVDRRYVDLGVTRSERERTIETAAGPVRARLVGAADGQAQAIVVFVHGRGGDRRLGMNDWSFGGNFNRLKNLMSKARGLYVTFDAGALGEADGGRLDALLAELRVENPDAPLVLACASMGGALCWQLAGSAESAARLNGLLLLGASSSPQSVRGARPGSNGRPIPIVFAHGSRDAVYPLAAQEAAFEAARSSHPSRFVAFDGGTHGTPLRMIDWRAALNWILSR